MDGCVFPAVAVARNSIRQEERSKTKRGKGRGRERKKEAADQGGRKKEINVYRRGREAYKRYTSEQIKIVESSSIYGLAQRNCNHLTTTLISIFSFLSFFLTPANKILLQLHKNRMNRILEYLSILPSLSHHLFRIINFNDLSFPFAKEHVAAKIEGNECLNSNRQFYSKDSQKKKKFLLSCIYNLYRQISRYVFLEISFSFNIHTCNFVEIIPRVLTVIDPLLVQFEFDVEISRVVNWLAKSLLRDVPKEFSARRKTLRGHFNSATVYKKEERRDPSRLTFVIYTS